LEQQQQQGVIFCSLICDPYQRPISLHQTLETVSFVLSIFTNSSVLLDSSLQAALLEHTTTQQASKQAAADVPPAVQGSGLVIMGDGAFFGRGGFS
jgi:hypothetical protein